jgi:hypothetical protein
MKANLSWASTWFKLHLYFLGSRSTDCSDWQFFTTSDPTNGLVTYQSREEAIQKKLAIVQDGVTILSVDNTTSLSAGENRDS